MQVEKLVQAVASASPTVLALSNLSAIALLSGTHLESGHNRVEIGSRLVDLLKDS